MKILGISAFYHDSAAALIVDGEIISAAQEERFTRKKNDERFPLNSIDFCLKDSGLKLTDIDLIAFYEKPFIKFERLIETFIFSAPRGYSVFRKAMPLWVKEKLFQKNTIVKGLLQIEPSESAKAIESKLRFSEHHLSHAASAFFPSPFDSALILTMDGVGEWATTSVAVGTGNELKILKEIHFPHSIGLLYSAFTYFIGFKVNSGEYKLMGLAPYGEPRFRDLILDKMIDLKPDGSFRLNQEYFNYCTGLTMTNTKFAELFGIRARQVNDPLEQIHMDMAASIQAVTEEIVLRIARTIKQETGLKNICLAGGVALNCVANGKLARENIFENIWVQPAAGDSGGAIGAALAAYYLEIKSPRKPSLPDSMKGSFLGTHYSQQEIEQELENLGGKFHQFSQLEMTKNVAQLLAEGKVIGWMQGRMEFGPRALGARSILADPRDPEMQSKLNIKTKFRESFRPFAPAILTEHQKNWFECNTDSPYMQLVAHLNKSQLFELSEHQQNTKGLAKQKIPRSSIPAVTHVDNSARFQTVSKETNPLFHQLLTEFHKITNCPVLINTSFNVRGEPIVESSSDAFRCFMNTEIDVLVIGNFLLYKNEQNASAVSKPNVELD